MKNIRLFTIAFGDQYLNWFERGCVLSLGWPRNRGALNAVQRYDVWTTKRDAPRAEAIAKKLGIPVEVHATMAENAQTENLCAALVGQMDLCARTDSAFIFAAPDSVFGDGSIHSFIQIGQPAGLCVAAVPLRVREEGFLEALGSGPVSNAELVKMGFERMHVDFRNADVSLGQTNSQKSGMSWRTIGDGLYAISYRMYSAYFMQPNNRDVKWLRDRPKFGNYDWSFPQTLVEQERQRVVGSSDAAFIVELTPDVPRTCSLGPNNPEEPDSFFRDRGHHKINRNLVSIWRAA